MNGLKNSKITTSFIILSIFLVLSCSTNDSITNSSNQSNLSKPNDFKENYPPPRWNEYNPSMEKLALSMLRLSEYELQFCLFFTLGSMPWKSADDELCKPYDFRDDFLLNSDKGIDYIVYYYRLSKYGIENNLVMKHSMEHLSLMNTGIEVSSQLQYGTNDNQILINRSTYDDLKEIVKIYRDSENHTEIDVVLDYLENDLEKYYNKTKSEVAVDFQ